MIGVGFEVDGGVAFAVIAAIVLIGMFARILGLIFGSGGDDLD